MSVAMELRRVDRQQSGSGVQLSGRSLFNTQDYLPDMQGQNGTIRYERIRRDPEVAGALLRIKYPLLAASWVLEPPKSGTNVKAMMDLCERYVMGPAVPGGPTFQSSILPHALLALDFGFAPFEKVWGIDEKGRQVYARIAPILPQSVFEFVLGEMGTMERMVQYAYVLGQGFKKQEIPDSKVAPNVRAEDKLAVITFRKEGDDFFGRSLLRECYQPWFHKSELWTLDGLQKERHGMGLTVITLPTSIVDVNSDEYKAAEKMVFEMRAHERNGAVIGDGWKIEQLFPTGTAPDIIGSQEYCDQQIARRMGTEYANLGATASGSRALSESKIDLFMILEQTLANWIEEFVNTQLIPGLIRMNLGQVKELPRVQCENIGNMTGKQAAEIVKLLHDSQMLRYDRKLEEHLRENNDLPEIDDATREEPPDPMALAAAGRAGAVAEDKKPSGAGGQGAVKEENNANSAQVAKVSLPTALPVYPPNLGRAPLPHEAHFAASETSTWLDGEAKRIWYRVVAPYRAQQIERLAAAAPGVTDEEFAVGKLGNVPFVGRLTASLAAALGRVYMTGRSAVMAERARQLAGVKTAAEMGEADEDMAPTRAQRRWVDRISELYVTGMIGALVSAGVVALKNARNVEGVTRAAQEVAVRNAMTALSVPVQQANLGGAIVQSYTNGRNEQALSMAADIQTAHYSALMDQNTCEVCAAFDGAEHDPEDATYATPNPNCEGGDRCRCVTIYVWREAAA